MPNLIVLAAMLATAGLYVAPPTDADGHDHAAGPQCPDYDFVPDLGNACLEPNGLWHVFGPNGEDLGYTHGPDPIPPAEEPVVDGGASHPICVDGTTTPYYGRIIYARAHDAADNYAMKVSQIRGNFMSANALMYLTAQNSLATRDYVMHCTGGEVTIDNVVLPTDKEDAHFGTIVYDLLNLGYADGRVKYWVWYDDPGACGCGGMGHIIGDSRANANNWNNGNAGPMFGITYGYFSAGIMMHENGHNLGAVQLGSPNSSGGWHCNDGRDVMCYADGGPNSHLYNNYRCYAGTPRWDCLGDDYFNPLPLPGTYLFNHWNLGASYVRFIQGEDLVLPLP